MKFFRARRLASTLAFLFSVLCLLSSILSGCAVINSGTATPPFCPRPWIGETALDPLDSEGFHAFQRTLMPAYTRIAVDWSIAVTNWTRADALFSLNAGSRIMAGIHNTNDLTVASNAIAAVIARYTNTIWGLIAYSEPDAFPSVTNYVPYVKLCRYLIDHAGYHGKIKLIGPSTSNDWIDGYLSNLWVLGVISNLDVITAHDYFACPGNGQCTNGMCSTDGICAGSYVHPNDSPWPEAGYPNLAGRLQNMHYWASVAGASRTVILEEYCLYSGDVNDARLTAQIIGSNNAVVVFTSPAYRRGLCPTSNGVVGGPTGMYWSDPMKAFMSTACTLP